MMMSTSANWSSTSAVLTRWVDFPGTASGRSHAKAVEPRCARTGRDRALAQSERQPDKGSRSAARRYFFVHKSTSGFDEVQTMHDQLLRLDDVRRMLGGVSKSTVYAWMKWHRFPPGVHIGENTVAWRPEQVRRWIDERERLSA